jgi:hypothetical protein
LQGYIVTLPDTQKQRFLEGALATGLEAGLVRAEDVFAELPPDVLVRHLPAKLRAKLFSACLSSQRVTATFMLDVIGLEALTMYAPPELLWHAVEQCMKRALDGKEADGERERVPKNSYVPSGLDEDTFNGSVGVESIEKAQKPMNMTLEGIGDPRSVTHSDAFDVILDDGMDEVVTAVGVSVTGAGLDTHPRSR